MKKGSNLMGNSNERYNNGVKDVELSQKMQSQNSMGSALSNSTMEIGSIGSIGNSISGLSQSNIGSLGNANMEIGSMGSSMGSSSNSIGGSSQSEKYNNGVKDVELSKKMGSQSK